jgi:hypothetical protein
MQQGLPPGIALGAQVPEAQLFEQQSGSWQQLPPLVVVTHIAPMQIPEQQSVLLPQKLPTGHIPPVAQASGSHVLLPSLPLQLLDAQSSAWQHGPPGSATWHTLATQLFEQQSMLVLHGSSAPQVGAHAGGPHIDPAQLREGQSLLVQHCIPVSGAQTLLPGMHLLEQHCPLAVQGAPAGQLLCWHEPSTQHASLHGAALGSH